MYVLIPLSVTLNAHFVSHIFVDPEQCLTKHSDDICSYGASSQVVRYYYDQDDNECYNFLFDIECSSSGNIFQTKSDCEKTCKRASFQRL